MSARSAQSFARWRREEPPAARGASGWLDDLDEPQQSTQGPPRARGLSRPLPGVQAEGGLAFGPCVPDGRLVIVGAHGGAGEDTLAGLDPELLTPGGHAWPVGGSFTVLVTARSNQRGLTALQEAGRQHAAGALTGLQLLGAVVIDDAPKVPRELERFAKIAGGLFPRMWRVPFSEELRVTGTLPPELPKPLTRLLNDLRALQQQALTT